MAGCDLFGCRATFVVSRGDENLCSSLLQVMGVAILVIL